MMDAVGAGDPVEPAEVVVAGHICLDIIPALAGAITAFAPGQTVEAGPAVLATGGAVANTGRTLHRLGVRTRLMGKVGDDLFGRAIREILAAESPALSEGLIVSPGEHTSYSVILSPPGADRMLFHAPGCNATFGAGDLRYDDLDSARLLHVGYPPLMDRLWHDGGSQLAALFRRAKERGVTTSLDLAMPAMESDAARADWNTILRAALPYVDLFVPSASEALLLCRRALYDQLRNESDDTGLLDHLAPSLLSELSTGFLGMGTRIVGLKLGHRGLYLRTAGAHALAEMGRAQPADVVSWAARELLAPCFTTTVVGTTGAGDVTVAGLLMALLRGMTPEETLIAACAIGACGVEAADAVGGVRSWPETHARVAAGWARLPTRVDTPGWRWDAAHALWTGPNDGHPPAPSAGPDTSGVTAAQPLPRHRGEGE